MKKIFIVFLFLIYNLQTFTYEQTVHKYLTWHAWELVKSYHPEIQNSEMDIHFGEWNNGS